MRRLRNVIDCECIRECWHCFSNRVINRWNRLDQQTVVQVCVLSCLIRNKRMMTTMMMMMMMGPLASMSLKLG